MKSGDEDFIISLHSNGKLQFWSLSDLSRIFTLKTLKEKEKNYEIRSMKYFVSSDDSSYIILHILDQETKSTVFRSYSFDIELKNGSFIVLDEYYGDKIISNKVRFLIN